MQRLNRILLTVVCCVFFTTLSLAQRNDNFQEVDATTYRLYLEEKWDSLIYASKEALKNDIDYYYLRMRVGIAYYQLQKYRFAAKHFEKALSFNTVDEIAMEYLYFSYVFSGKKYKATALSKRFPDSMKERLKLNQIKLVEEVYIEGGPTLGANQPPKGNPLHNNPNLMLAESELTNDVIYFSLGLRHQLFKWMDVFHSVSSIDIGKTQYLNVYNGVISNDYRIYQRQYYINTGIYLGKGFRLSPAFHLISVNFDKLYYDFNDENKLLLTQQTYNPTEYAGSISLTKDFALFDLGLNASYARLNNNEFLQTGMSLGIYPLGNSNLYLNTDVTIQHITDEKRLVIDPKFGFKLLPKVWLEGNYTIGQINNFVEKNAYVVYNINDNILSRKGLSINIFANKNIHLSLIYQNLTKENSRTIVNQNKNIMTINTNKFNNHTIIGGIKWTL